MFCFEDTAVHGRISFVQYRTIQGGGDTNFIEYCVFPKILKYSGLWPLSVCLGVSVCTHQAGRTPALKQNWKSSENHKILRKNTIFNEHPVYEYIYPRTIMCEMTVSSLMADRSHCITFFLVKTSAPTGTWKGNFLPPF